jgi:hypothetical protein
VEICYQLFDESKSPRGVAYLLRNSYQAVSRPSPRRKRVDGMLTELADARTATMISGCEAAVPRTQLAF